MNAVTKASMKKQRDQNDDWNRHAEEKQ